MAKSRKLEARTRAREAKAKMDARRALRDEQISKVQTEYFLAVAEREDAQEAIEDAELAMAKAIQTLGAGDFKVSVEDLADLCDLTASEVRAFKKRELPTTSPSTPAGDSPEPQPEAATDEAAVKAG